MLFCVSAVAVVAVVTVAASVGVVTVVVAVVEIGMSSYSGTISSNVSTMHTFSPETV